MRRSSFILTAVAAVQAAATAGLLAYATWGVTWSSSTVPYYVNPANLDLAQEVLIAGVQAGASTWHDQSTAEVSLAYAGQTTGTQVTNNGKNEVMFRNATNGSAVATTYRYSSNGRILDADIVFWDGAFKFFTGTSGCSGGLYVEDIAAHEFGHALGLAHTSVGEATMYASVSYCSQALRSLAADDQAGIEALYPAGGSPPAAPSGAAAAANSGAPESAIDVTWQDNASNEDNYLVERSTDGISWLQVASLGSNARSYTNSGLAAGTTYSYRVRASNASGFSGYSNVATASTASSATQPPSAPATPSPTSGKTNVDTSVTLSWTCSGAASYRVYFGTSSPPPPYAAGLTSPSLAVSGLANSKTFYWQVVATNPNGNTSSSVWQFTTRGGKGRK